MLLLKLHSESCDIATQQRQGTSLLRVGISQRTHSSHYCKAHECTACRPRLKAGAAGQDTQGQTISRWHTNVLYCNTTTPAIASNTAPCVPVGLPLTMQGTK